MQLFERSNKNPILCPNPEHPWEAFKLYNPGAIFHEGHFHLFYRAVGKGANWRSAIGYAVSLDGENFQRDEQPLLEANEEYEKRGLEDPRISKVDDIFYMTYAAYDGQTPRLSVASSKDLRSWTKHGPALSGWSFESAGGIFTKFDEQGQAQTTSKPYEWSKSGAIFPEKIAGKFRMLFGEHCIWFAESDDGIRWRADNSPFLRARSGDFFDNCFVEMGPPPIRTETGWLILYHGIDRKHRYRLGFAILDLDDPRKILYRSSAPIFEPSADYELSGPIDVVPGGISALAQLSKDELENRIKDLKKNQALPRVIFCNGATLIGKELRIFYGAADLHICSAKADIDTILDLYKKL